MDLGKDRGTSKLWPFLVLVTISGLAVLFLLLAGCEPEPLSMPQPGPQGPVWLFDFGPEAAEPFEGFAPVSGRTAYDASRGYGWVEVEDDLEAGTFHTRALHWEGARNLNLVQRFGPDPLAGTFATGPAPFVLDVAPGRYDVWVLRGDWGLLEYIPHESYRIVVGDEARDFPGLPAEEFYRRFENPGPDDTLTDEDAYARYVEPHFRWEKFEVSVDGGPLKIQVLAPPRSRALLEKIGNYAHADIKQGPPHRFAGAMGALVVSASHPSSAERIERIQERRRAHFRQNRPRRASPQSDEALPPEERERGYRVFSVSPLETITPETTREHGVPILKARGTPGESVVITLGLRPNRELGQCTVRVPDLQDDEGSRIERTAIEMGVVRHRARVTHDREDPRWEPRPDVIFPVKAFRPQPGITKQIWMTVRVPQDATPGLYRGTIRIEPADGATTRIPVELEVLPFSLRRPSHLGLGLTYFVPIAYAYFDDGRFWDRIRADFESMRRHGMTTVQLTGMGLENFEGLDRLLGLYREAGFEQPVYLLESYTAIDLVSRVYGHAEGTEEFYARYLQIFRDLLEEARKRDWPPVIFNFGDEFTNSAREEFGAELARRLATLPGIVTAADANGYLEVKLLAPHVSILAFNRGWSGPNGVNGDRQLLNEETVELVRAGGAEPWFVNVRKDRFSNGFYLWKMSRRGVLGKIEWIFSNYRVEPHNPFHQIERYPNTLAHAGPSNTTLPTLAYERMRMGLDDLAYLYTLEELVQSAPRGAARQKGRALLEALDAMIDDDFGTYRGEGAEFWSAERFEELRGEVIDAILLLRSSPRGPFR